MDGRIEFLVAHETRLAYAIPDRWQFKPRGRFGRVLAAAFRWAVKHKYFENAVGEELKVTRTVVQPQSVVEALFQQKSEVMKQLNREATTVLMGCEDYAELMRLPNVYQYMTLPAQANDSRGVLGLTLKIVPWLRGIVVLP
jgi:hypothetical protein